MARSKNTLDAIDIEGVVAVRFAPVAADGGVHLILSLSRGVDEVDGLRVQFVRDTSFTRPNNVDGAGHRGAVHRQRRASSWQV